MSKTLGNVIDPVDTIKEFGTDALRFTLALGTAGQVCYAVIVNFTTGTLTTFSTDVLPCLFQDLNLSNERLTSNKAFTNKLWNAGKFVLQNLPSPNDACVWENILFYRVVF